jgi:hypothetical protein
MSPRFKRKGNTVCEKIELIDSQYHFTVEILIPDKCRKRSWDNKARTGAQSDSEEFEKRLDARSRPGCCKFPVGVIVSSSSDSPEMKNLMSVSLEVELTRFRFANSSVIESKLIQNS